MGDFKKLDAWRRSVDLVAAVYQATARLPAAERFGLQGQLRRAAVSIVANIAEGTGRGTDPELVRFLRIARGSASEVECLCLVGERLGYLDPPTSQNLIQDTRSVSSMLSGLQRRLAGPREQDPLRSRR